MQIVDADVVVVLSRDKGTPTIDPRSGMQLLRDFPVPILAAYFLCHLVHR